VCCCEIGLQSLQVVQVAAEAANFTLISVGKFVVSGWATLKPIGWDEESLIL
jgi:hypothetical protein